MQVDGTLTCRSKGREPKTTRQKMTIITRCHLPQIKHCLLMGVLEIKIKEVILSLKDLSTAKYGWNEVCSHLRRP